MSDLEQRRAEYKAECGTWEKDDWMTEAHLANAYIEALEAEVERLTANRDFWHESCLKAWDQRDMASVLRKCAEDEKAAERAEVERLTRDRDEVYLLSTGCIYEGGGTEMVYTDLDLALAHIEEAAAGGQYGDPVEWPYVRDEECERLDWVVRAYLASGMDYLRLTRQVTNQVPGSLQFLRDRAALAAEKGENDE